MVCVFATKGGGQGVEPRGVCSWPPAAYARANATPALAFVSPPCQRAHVRHPATCGPPGPGDFALCSVWPGRRFGASHPALPNGHSCVPFSGGRFAATYPRSGNLEPIVLPVGSGPSAVLPHYSVWLFSLRRGAVGEQFIVGARLRTPPRVLRVPSTTRGCSPAARPRPARGEPLGFGLHLSSCLLYTSPSPRDAHESRMPSSA